MISLVLMRNPQNWGGGNRHYMQPEERVKRRGGEGGHSAQGPPDLVYLRFQELPLQFLGQPGKASQAETVPGQRRQGAPSQGQE